MINTITVLGPSRAGKGAIIPLLASANNTELPFNTPDLDWYVDSYNTGDMSKETTCKLIVNYLITYSWYCHLGRHTNLRTSDYYSIKKLKDNNSISHRYDLMDNDEEFLKFIDNNQREKILNIFQIELDTTLYEYIKKYYPIRLNPIFIYRSPFYLFTSWFSSNRVNRSLGLSRMLKYSSVEYIKNKSLLESFVETKNNNEVSFDKNTNKYTYYDFKYKDRKITKLEEEYLLKKLKQNYNSFQNWEKYNNVYFFERVVSEPVEVVNNIISNYKITINKESCDSAIHFMDKRKFETIFELDQSKILNELTEINCCNDTINTIIKMHKTYLSDFNKKYNTDYKIE